MLFALRHYDLDDSGTTNLRQFGQFLNKFGIHHYSPQEVANLFEKFDFERRGYVEHKELIARLLGETHPHGILASAKPKESQLASPAKVDPVGYFLVTEELKRLLT